MAKKEIVFQGFTEQTHLSAIKNLFEIDEIQHVILSAAFVSSDGVDAIADILKPNAACITILAGIRNDITSYQGLLALLPLSKNFYAVDTGTRRVLYHPKIYHVRGKKDAKTMIGSANLTLGGLNNNIETSLYLQLNLGVKDDLAVVQKIESHTDGIIKEHPSNILKISSEADINALLDRGLIVDESIARAPSATRAKESSGNTDTTPRIKLKTKPPYAKKPTVSLSKVPTKKAKSVKIPKAKAVVAPQSSQVSGQFKLVYQSKPLTLRDLNIPDGPKTNQTGSINLDKGLLDAEIDHRHHFRDDIFDKLDWLPATTTTEYATGKFVLVIKGVNYGSHVLTVRHTTSTDTAAYIQNNAMIRLSWGKVKSLIRNPNLVDSTLSLYVEQNSSDSFMLEID